MVNSPMTLHLKTWNQHIMVRSTSSPQCMCFFAIHWTHQVCQAMHFFHSRLLIVASSLAAGKFSLSLWCWVHPRFRSPQSKKELGRGCGSKSKTTKNMTPDQTDEFAREHDAAVLGCLQALLGEAAPFPPGARDRASFPLHMGGLGLRSAHAHRAAAYWASWTPCPPCGNIGPPSPIASPNF